MNDAWKQLSHCISDLTRHRLLVNEKKFFEMFERWKIEHYYTEQSIRMDELEIMQEAQAFCGLLALVEEAMK